MKYFLGYALHSSVKLPSGAIATGLDGDGTLVQGNQRPVFDTLIGICNPTPHAVNVLFKFFNKDGTAVLWGDGSVEREYRLESKRSLATTLIPHNIFPDPPQDFIGYATLETRKISPFPNGRLDLPVYAMLGGGGFYPDHWNIFSPNVPVYTDEAGRSDRLIHRSHWTFPYLIPFFEDLNHKDDRSYRTGVVVTNFGNVPCWIHFQYTIGDVYPSAAQDYRFALSLGSHACIVEDLYPLLCNAGYVPKMNSEGWLEIKARESADPDSAEVPVLAAPYLLHSNAKWNLFSAGQGFWP